MVFGWDEVENDHVLALKGLEDSHTHAEQAVRASKLKHTQ
jgi:hypothetical protein